MQSLSKLRWLLLAAGAALTFDAYAATPEADPTRPVRLIAAFSPGGFVDFTARLVAGPLGAALGQQVIVENRAGAGGIVGTEAAARAAPDGHTLIEHLARVTLVHVPYKGGGPALVAVVAGEVPVTFGTAASVSPHTRSGRLRGLAVTSGQRSAVLPELPTIAEAGLPGYEMLNWLGLFAPAGTPRGVVDRLSAEVTRAVRTPEVVSRFHAQGAEPSPLPTDEFESFVRKEVDKWSKVVAATGMKAE
jgi:tripartite-type tricarboxylate transporter receptor subunit TctC